VSGTPSSSGRFRDWSEANPGALPRRASAAAQHRPGQAPDEAANLAPDQSELQPNVTGSQASATGTQTVPPYSTGTHSGQQVQPYTPEPYPAPTYDQPGYDQPAYDQPQYGQPGYAQPGYAQPAYDQPAYDQPGYAQPGYAQPGYGQPGGYGFGTSAGSTSPAPRVDDEATHIFRPRDGDSYGVGPATSATTVLRNSVTEPADRSSGRRPRKKRRSDPGDPAGPWPTRVSGPSALAAVALIILVAVVAVVALPRVLNRNAAADVFDQTALTQPAELAGLPRVADAKITDEDRRSAERLLSAVSAPLIRQTLVYGRGTGVRVTVVTGRPAAALSQSELDILRNGFTTGLGSAGAPVKELDAGPLGGWFGCGQTELSKTLCLALDSGALVSVTVATKDASAFATARAAREAVEHRIP
jgi:hypothetical protein